MTILVYSKAFASRLAAALAVVVFTATSPILAQRPTLGSVSVEVTGTGTSKWSAQSDAIRQALQQTLKQLVIADRAVSDNEVLKDQVISTLNGFVEKFEIINETSIEGGWELKCKITVSPSRIAAYVATGKQSSASVQTDGNTMLAAVSAAQEQRKANTALALRVLDGFPWNVIDARITSLDPLPTQDKVVVNIGVRFNASFLQNIKDVANELPSDGNVPDGGVAVAEQLDFLALRKRPKGYQVSNKVVLGVAPIDDTWTSQLPPFNTFGKGRIPLLISTEKKLLITAGVARNGDYQPYDAGECFGAPLFAISQSWIEISPAEMSCKFLLPTAFFKDAKKLAVEVTKIPETWRTGTKLTIPQTTRFREERWLADSISYGRYLNDGGAPEGGYVGFTSFWKRVPNE